MSPIFWDIKIIKKKFLQCHRGWVRALAPLEKRKTRKVKFCLQSAIFHREPVRPEQIMNFVQVEPSTFFCFWLNAVFNQVLSGTYISFHYTAFRWSIVELLSWCLSSKQSACQCKRCGFDPWVRKILCRRKWQPIPVFLPGKFHGQKSLAGYSLWDHKESDMT